MEEKLQSAQNELKKHISSTIEPEAFLNHIKNIDKND